MALMSSVLAACSAGSSSSRSTAITEVTVSRDQPSIPPQYRTPYRRTYTDSATLQRISASISSRGVGPGGGTSAASCTGGSQWTVVISRADGSVSEVDAYQCGTAVTGNAGGDLAGFISDLQQLP